MTRDTTAAGRGARRGWAIACVVAWVGAFVATHVPAEQLPNLPVESDKTLHFLGYLFLGLLLLGSLSSRGRRGPRRWLTVVGVMVVYAAFDEGTQPLVNRYAAWGDAWADILGGLVAIGVWEAVAGARRLAGSPAG
jgi:VanZ family protein